MTKILLEFEFPAGTDGEEASAAVEKALRELEEVDQVAAEESDPRIGVVEAATIVTAVVTLVRSGRELVVEAQELTRLARAALNHLRGARRVAVDHDGTRTTVQAAAVTPDG
jgi:hypothetical protein